MELLSHKINIPGYVCKAHLTFLITGTTSCSADKALLAREKCLTFLCEKMSQFLELTDYQKNELKIYDRTKEKEFVWMDNFMGIHPFFIPRGKRLCGSGWTFVLWVLFQIVLLFAKSKYGT